MAACRSTILAFSALILTGSSSAQSDFIDVGKSRVIIVKIPAGTFGMGSDQVIRADDAWKPLPSLCSPQSGRAPRAPIHHQQGFLDGSVRCHSETMAGGDGQQPIRQPGNRSRCSS